MKQNSKSALLVMDMQTSILQGYPNENTLLINVGKSVELAKKNNLLVIYVIVGFRPGTPEININNKMFAGGGKDRWLSINMENWIKIHPNLTPASDDIIVTKRRVSAFSGSDLDIVLRAQNIDHIILTGVATGGVVLSTVREAADKDYRISVLSDCFGDRDDEVHNVLINKIFPRQAEVLSVFDWENII